MGLEGQSGGTEVHISQDQQGQQLFQKGILGWDVAPDRGARLSCLRPLFCDYFPVFGLGAMPDGAQALVLVLTSALIPGDSL